MGGGVGSWPIAGTAVYMTAYPRLKEDDGTTPTFRDWEDILPVRKWLYQTPEQILIKGHYACWRCRLWNKARLS